MHRSGVGPGDIRKVAEDSVEVDGVGRAQPMRESVQPQVRVGGRRRCGIHIDFDRDDLDGDRAALIGDGELFEVVRWA